MNNYRKANISCISFAEVLIVDPYDHNTDRQWRLLASSLHWFVPQHYSYLINQCVY